MYIYRSLLDAKKFWRVLPNKKEQKKVAFFLSLSMRP